MIIFIKKKATAIMAVAMVLACRESEHVFAIHRAAKILHNRSRQRKSGEERSPNMTAARNDTGAGISMTMRLPRRRDHVLFVPE